MIKICMESDEYIRELIRSTKMTWKITLIDGTVVWGDVDRYAVDGDEPNELKPWNRLKKYCQEKGLSITKVQVIVMGAPEEVIYEDSEGADGILVKRGFSRSQDMESGHSQAFQNLVVGVLNEEADKIDVYKYSWPHNTFEESHQKRIPTEENTGEMLFKSNSKKEIKIKELLNIGEKEN
jgi:hypothetical protein